MSSDYLQNVLLKWPDVAARYTEKITKINGVDPFTLKEAELSYQVGSFPPVTSMDLVSYLVLTTSTYTMEQMKAFKSLNAFKYFDAGFVHKCGAITINNYTVVIGRVKHSMKMNELPVQVWVMCQDNGAVETAHCTCMAGAGEVCSHVGAVLYALQHVQTSKETTSCTDVTAAWNVPKVSKVEYQPLKHMDFRRIIAGHKLTGHVPPIEGEEAIQMFRSIEGVGSSSVMMRVMEPFASEMEVVDEIVRNVYREIHNLDFEELNYEALLQQATVCSIETLSDDDCLKIRNVTKQQARSSLWFQQRTGRITASNFRAVCKTSIEAPSKSLIKMICYPTNFLFKTKATIWGTTHEKDALAAYLAYSSPMHEGLHLEQVGLCLSPTYMQFGASPDSMVTCECCGTGCIEVKCPYLLTQMNLKEFAAQKGSCLEQLESGELSLRKDHSYYYQVQMQMALTGVNFCDFVIWGPKNDFFLERMFFNEDFWASESCKAIEFHNRVIMPELLGRFFTRTEATVETWCTCGGIDDGRAMLCCGNDDCLIRWHHLECVGLHDIPLGAWYCNTCAPDF